MYEKIINNGIGRIIKINYNGDGGNPVIFIENPEYKNDYSVAGLIGDQCFELADALIEVGEIYHNEGCNDFY